MKKQSLHYYRGEGTTKQGERVFFVFLNYDTEEAANHASKVFSHYGIWYDSVKRITTKEGNKLVSNVFKPC